MTRPTAPHARLITRRSFCTLSAVALASLALPRPAARSAMKAATAATATQPRRHRHRAHERRALRRGRQPGIREARQLRKKPCARPTREQRDACGCGRRRAGQSHGHADERRIPHRHHERVRLRLRHTRKPRVRLRDDPVQHASRPSEREVSVLQLHRPAHGQPHVRRVRHARIRHRGRGKRRWRTWASARPNR